MAITRKHIGWLVALGVVAAALWFFFGRAPAPESEAARFETATVDRGRIVAKVTATGTLSALVTVQVGSQVSGRVQTLNVDFNDAVKKGQVIATVDPRVFEAQIDQARANDLAAHGNLARARAQASEAERQLVRVASLAAQKLVSEADLDAARAAAEVARATARATEGQVAQTAAAVRQAKLNLDYTTILSPIDGIVVSRAVDVGQTVAASFQAPVLFTLAEDLRKMQVNTSVAEADVGKLRPGMASSFIVDAYPGKRFKGVVRQIRNAPQTVQNVVTYDAVIDVDNPELELRPGMTANVTFTVAEREGVLRLPNAALRFRAPPEMLEGEQNGRRRGRGGAGGAAEAGGPQPATQAPPPIADDEPGRRTVWLLKDDKPTQVRVRPGLTDGLFTELLEESGGAPSLREGDTLVTDVTSTGKPKPRMRFF